MARFSNYFLYLILGGMFMLTQACDQSPPGEEIAAKTDPGQDSVIVNVGDTDGPEVEPIPIEEPVINPIVPIPVEPIGDNTPANGPGHGGGSQGALQPVETGNPDGEEPSLFGKCGNDEQEVLHSLKGDCPFLLYGVTNRDRLVHLFEKTGAGAPVASISNIHDVSAIDFDAEGVLYGVGLRNGDNRSVFARIDCITGEATPIGDTNIEDVLPTCMQDPTNCTSLITDINFDSNGKLWAFLENQRYAGTINRTTGEFTPVSTVAILGNNIGDGLGFFPFPLASLYNAGDDNLVRINEADGKGTIVNPLNFVPAILANSNPYINAMDNDALFNTMYVSINSNVGSYLGIIDISSGSSSNVDFVTTNQVTAPEGLDAIAVNHRFEECDTDVVSTTECINCLLHEADCANGIDDDFDGLTDCEDFEDCLNKPCDDDDTCTQNDTCTVESIEGDLVLVCEGKEVVCNDENPCTIDVCCNLSAEVPSDPHFCCDPTITDPSDPAFCCDPTITDPANPAFCGPGDNVPVIIPPSTEGVCGFRNDETKGALGSCETDGRACTVGKCAADVVNPDNLAFICFETDRKFVSTSILDLNDVPLGCLDNNECTADSCVESWIKEGHPSNGDVINPTAVPWGSLANVDEFGNVILDNDFQCVNEAMPQSPCFDAGTCRDGACLITGTGMPGAPSDIQCVPNDARLCDVNADCIPDLEACNIDGICVDINCPDVDDNECTDNTCDLEAGGCVAENVTDGTSCNFDDLCIVGATCIDGECLGGSTTVCEQPVNICQENLCNPQTGSCPGVNDPPTNKPDGTDLNQPCEVPDADGICALGSLRCFGGQPTCIALHERLDEEICNNLLDDNCNGETDEGCGKLVFITETTTTGNFQDSFGGIFGGILAGDLLCNFEAALANKSGLYKAWLSDSFFSPSLTFSKIAPNGYVLVDGTLVAESWDDLITQKAGGNYLRAPIIKQADGSTTISTSAWTSTLPNGEPITGPTAASCQGWTTENDRGWIGSPFSIDLFWTFRLVIPLTPCTTSLPLYCFEQ